MASSSSKTILVTGCNSGIGLVAAKLLFQQNHRLILVARTMARAEATKQAIEAATSNNVCTFECDLSSFESIRSFGRAIHNHKDVASRGIDVVCLNAGMCTARNSKPQFTKDGLELTLATNHFGPFLLTHLLLDLVNSGGRIVITASGVHEEKKATFGQFKGVLEDDTSTDDQYKKNFNNLDGSDFHYFDSYAQSKLCNVAFCMELNRRLSGKKIVANCFTPGFISSTGLFQHQNHVLMSIFGFLANYVFRFGESEENGGKALAWMVTDINSAKTGGQYFKKEKKAATPSSDPLVVHPISKEAASLENQQKLWNISASLAGVDKDAI